VLDESGGFTVVLEPSVAIEGKVVVGMGGRAKILNGSIVATRKSRIAGRPDRNYQARLDDLGGFKLAVARTRPGEVYTLRIVSSDDTLYPPQSFVVPDVDADTHFDPVLDDPAQLTQVKGRITNAVGMPVAGLEVKALDASKSAVSTTATTDATGAYAIRLAKRATTTVTLVAEPLAGKAPMGTPSLQTLVNVSMPGTTTNTVTVPDLAIPPLPAVTRLTYRVIGISSSGAEQPVIAAHCAFTAQVSDPKTMVTAVFRAETQTDTDGTAAVDLIPAEQGTRDYHVSVSPSATSTFQGLSLTIPVGPMGGYGSPIMLKLRQEVRGRVVDMLQRPVKSLTVQPGLSTVAAGLTATTLAEVVKLSTATSDADGKFVLRVDSGTYEFGLLPPALTRLPRRWIESLEVAESLDLGDILVPPSAVVRATIVDKLGNGVLGASVQLYAISPINSACSTGELTCLAPPRLTAEGLTTLDGTVGLLLPAQVTAPANTR
jgi:hypothetical protein